MAEIVEYSSVEDAVREQILEKFGDLVRESTVGENFDAVWEAMMGDDDTFGAYLEFGGGDRARNPAFAPNGYFWRWTVICIFVIRYKDADQIEDDAKKVASRIANMFLDSPRLGGVVDWVMVDRIEPPEPVKVNDNATYWFGFEVNTYNQLR